MKLVCKIGDIKVFERDVRLEDVAKFESGVVHEVYATFALTRDAEWAGRLFVLDMLDNDEQGIGTFVELFHVSPAFVGQTVRIEAKLEKLAGNDVICSFEAKVKDRLVARGRTGQKILKKEKLNQHFAKLSE